MTFEVFVAQEDVLVPEQKEKIIQYHQSNNYADFIKLSFNLFIWSLFGITFNILILGHATVESYVDGLGWGKFYPLLFFGIVNYFAKFIYIKLFLKNSISLWKAIISVIPYLGSFILFRSVIKDNWLYRQLLYRHFQYKKKFFKKQVWRRCKRVYSV